MIAIITDSTCDIPNTLIKKHGIIVVSHYILWGDVEYRDRVNLQPEEFYQMLETNPVRPTTAQAGVSDFSEGIHQAVENGATEALILTVSSAMSGAYDMARQAAEQAEIPVRVIDSKGPTMSLGWQVLAAARARDAGASIKEIHTKVDEVRGKMVQIVAMETLEYLQTGGRIGEAAKWVGTLLNVRPVISINHIKGVVTPAGLARSHKAAVRMLYNKFFDAIEDVKALHIAVLHGNALEEAQKLVDRIRDEFDPVELIVNITGPVLGINTGPGALALCGYAEGEKA